MLLTFAVTTADGLRDAVAFQIGRERREPRAVWGTALRSLLVLAAFGMLVLLAFHHLVPGRPSYLFAAFAFPFALYVQAVGIIYLLREHIERINLKNMLTIGAGNGLVTLVLVVAFHAPLAVVMWAWVAVYACAAIWSAFGVRQMLGGSAQLGARGLFREQSLFAAKAGLSSNVTFLALRVDVFIVSALLSPAALGIYTLALATGEVLWGVSRAVTWSTTGRIAMLDLPSSAALTARAVRSLVAVQLVGAAALFLCGPWLIVAIYGARFATAGSVLRILLPGMVVYSADAVLSYFIAVRAGRPGLLLMLETTTLVVCAAVTLLSIRAIGIYGGALADTAAYLLSYAIKVTVFVRLSGVRFSEVLFPRASDVPVRARAFFGRIGGGPRVGEG